MRIHSDLADTIGNTPLLKLKRASEMTGCTILGKCEFLNPGQSVKDRAALYIIKDAVAKGLLKPGGTLAGIGMALQPKGVKVGLADPEGAALHAYYTTGKFEAPGSSITEGIGQGRITANLEGFTPDFSYRIPDAEALPLVFEMLQEEGICLGGSSGINIAGAIRMAKEIGPGHTIVTILCDYGNRYQSKLYNPAFLKEKGLPVPQWLDSPPSNIPTVFEDA